MKSRSYNKAI